MAALSLILDVAILICLVFTIYYALKLSDSLKRFRVHRKEFDQVIAELSRNINLAQQAIQALRETSQSSGRELETILEESRLMAEDLRLINQASDSLAERLEGLAERNSRVVQGKEDEYTGYGALAEESFSDMDDDFGNEESFAIQDRDFEEDLPDPVRSRDEGFESQAEQELYEALRQNKKRRAVG